MLSRQPSSEGMQATAQDTDVSIAQVAAIKAVRELAVNPEVCHDLVGAPVTSALVKHLCSSKPEVASAAAWALCTLVCIPSQQGKLLCPYDGCMPELLALAGRGEGAREAVTWVIHNLGSSRDNTPGLVEAGVLPVLVEGLASGSDLCKEAAARSISNLAQHSADTAGSAVSAGAVAPLLALLKGGNVNAESSSYSRRGAAMALCQLALWDCNRQMLVAEGGQELVEELLEELTPPRNPHHCGRAEVKLQEAAALALQNLLAGPGFHSAVLQDKRSVPSLLALLSAHNIAVYPAAGASLVNLLTHPSPAAPHKSEEQNSESSVEAAIKEMQVHRVPQLLVSMLVWPEEQTQHPGRRLQAVQVLSRLAHASPQGLAAFREANAMPAIIQQLGKWDLESSFPAPWAYAAAAFLADLPQGFSPDMEGSADSLSRMLWAEEPSILPTVISALIAVASLSSTERAKLAANTRAIKQLALLASPSPRAPASPSQHTTTMTEAWTALHASAASALSAIAADSDSARQAVARVAVRPLVKLLESGEAPVVESAAKAVGELARSSHLRRSLRASGAVWVLNSVHRNGRPEESAAAASALELLEPGSCTSSPPASPSPRSSTKPGRTWSRQQQRAVDVEFRSNPSASSGGAQSPLSDSTTDAKLLSLAADPLPQRSSTGGGRAPTFLARLRQSCSDTLSRSNSGSSWAATGLTPRRSQLVQYEVL
mmetsp:Transcript_18935/g.52809  ORF Transcript_18935/g.52809 Transcript_18935/m.52809 type:complete len:715 (-) Transcript_18935:668-2812(-)